MDDFFKFYTILVNNSTLMCLFRRRVTRNLQFLTGSCLYVLNFLPKGPKVIPFIGIYDFLDKLDRHCALICESMGTLNRIVFFLLSITNLDLLVLVDVNFRLFFVHLTQRVN